MVGEIKIKLFLILIIALCVVKGSYSQSGSFLDDTNIDTFTLGGNISVSASFYRVDGIENRRAPGMIQTNAGMNFSTFGLSSGLNLNYSTDESGLRQNMNTISYNVSWRWINLQAGDMNTRFSEYGLNGATVRGGYIRLNPGDFLLELVGGRSRRAVRPSFETGFREPSFEQWAYGGKIGYGNTSSSFFHLSSFYALDNRTSIEGTNLEITPNENLTVTPEFQLQFFNGKATIGSDFTASIFTRDLNSSVVPIGQLPIPDIFGSVYSPRVSSKINYAGNVNASFVLDMLSMSMDYERIQPGYRSLGSGRTRDDQEKIGLSPTIRLLDNRLSIGTSYSFSKDNLLGNRVQTQRNTNAGTNIQYSISEFISINTNYNLLYNSIKPEETSEELTATSQTQISHNVMLQPVFTIRRDQTTHNISVSVGYMSIESKFEASDNFPQENMLSESITSGLNYSLNLPTGLSFNSSANYLTNQSNEMDMNNFGLNFGGSYSFFDRKLSLNANVGVNRNNRKRESTGGELISSRVQQVTGSVNSSYSLTDKDTFNLTLRTRGNSIMEGEGREFSELEGSFRYQRRF